MARQPVNTAASVRQRLLNLARENGRDFQTLLVAFGLERLIYRLSVSPHRDSFVLKGGMLVTLWTSDPGRFTRDIDFLGFGSSDEDALRNIFASILSSDANDGLHYGAADLTVRDIREGQIYGGNVCARLRRWTAPGYRSRLISVLATRSQRLNMRSCMGRFWISPPPKFALTRPPR